MHFLEKTLYKLKLLFTNPGKFFGILHDVIAVRFFPTPEPKEGKRFTTDSETRGLKKYASAAKFGIVEIGVLDGLTTREMALVSSAPIYGIDPIIPDSMNKRLLGSEEKIRQNMSFYPKFRLFKDYSFNVVKAWANKFDFIFIDGDHNYEAVRQDFEQWLPLLESGGFVGFHDSAPVTSLPSDFPGWPGPVRLVSELKADPRLEFVETIDSLSVFKKK